MVPVAGVAAVAPVVKEAISAGAQYLACREQEKTKRAEIAARLEASLTVIEKNYDALNVILSENHKLAMDALNTLNELIRDESIKSDKDIFKHVLSLYMEAHKLYSEKGVQLAEKVNDAGRTSRY